MSACDSHFHVFGPEERYPYSSDLRYTPPNAPLEDYLEHARELKVILERRVRRRVAQVRGIRISLLGAEDVKMAIAGAHSIWMPASFTSFTKASASARKYCVNSPGEALATRSIPRSAYFFFISGLASAFATAACRRSSTSRGVAAGATIPFHVTSSKPA